MTYSQDNELSSGLSKGDSRVTILDKEFKTFIYREKIQQRIRMMAAEMARDYEGKKPVFLSILTGSFMFTSDLMKHFPLDCEIAFTRLSSYEGTQSTGQVTTLLGIKEELKGRHIIVVEDIIDSGKTLHSFLPVLQQEEPASIAIATLLIKPEALKYDLDIRYKGFEISNEFIVGYGLDYDGYGRNLQDIYQVVE